MNQLKFSLILLLFAVAAGLGDRGNVLAFAVGHDASQNETDSIDVSESPSIPVIAILRTPKNVQNEVRFNRTNNFCHNQNAILIMQNVTAMTVQKKDIKIDIENTIIVKLRI